jgi:hypothetical protein
MTRYRTNLSYPAFSNCSADNNPGDGTASSGDLIGAINGHVEWTDDIVDRPDRWEITLFLRDLRTTSGSDPAPDSAQVDVTLRRLQAFRVPAGYGLRWENRRKDEVVQSGWVIPEDGLLTIPEVAVYRDSSRLVAWPVSNAVSEQRPIPLAYGLEQNYPNPFNGISNIAFRISEVAEVRLQVFDLLGREVATPVSERMTPGAYAVRYDGAGLASGIYLYRLTAGGKVLTRKMLLMK